MSRQRDRYAERARTKHPWDAPLTRAERNIRWIEKHCYVPEGKGMGHPVKLRPWQKHELRKIYDNPAGTRRAIISFGRKNGKTALVAFLLLLHLVGPESVQNGQLYSAAQARDQAALIFKLASKCVRMSPTLAGAVVIGDTAKKLSAPARGTEYRALSAEAKTAYGLSPVFIVHDELGQVRGPTSDLYEALETATGAHEEVLTVIISTQAPNPIDLLSQLIDQAENGDDPTVTLSLYTAPEDLDPFDPETIKLANPAYGDFLRAERVNGMARDAKELPSREPEYRNLILNQRVEMFAPFVSRSIWKVNGGPVNPDMKGVPLYGGLDLSGVHDLTAKVYKAPRDGKWHIHPTFWLPQNGLRTKARQDQVPYDLWEKEGYLRTTPGKTVGYDFVAETLYQDFVNYDVRAVGFDRWNMKFLRPELRRAGFRDWQVEGDRALFVEIGQGYQSMSPALRDLETELLDEKLRHGMHPVLSMCAAVAVVTSDPAGNRKLDKQKATGRIDGMIALAIATSVAATHEFAGPSVYEERGARIA